MRGSGRGGVVGRSRGAGERPVRIVRPSGRILATIRGLNHQRKAGIAEFGTALLALPAAQRVHHRHRRSHHHHRPP